MKTIGWAVLLCGWWSMFLFAGIGCAPDDDDDNQVFDDDVVIDDDAADDNQADDDAGDDDAGDDDVGDDDANDNAALMEGLMVIGTDENYGQDSYVYLDGEWREQPFPLAFGDHDCHAGPSFFSRGEKGYLACNRYLEDAYGFIYIYLLTEGYEWIVYTPGQGWHTDGAPPKTGILNNAGLAFAPQPDALWVYSFFEYDETDHGWPGYHYIQFGRLYRHGALRPHQEWGGAGSHLTALYLTDIDSGLASIHTTSDDEQLLVYDGNAWQAQDMPAGFEDGEFLWFSLLDENNGYGIWRSDAKGRNRVAELHNGVWTMLTPPAGCETMLPNRVRASGDYAIVTEQDADFDNRFWELRNGTWSCRQVGDQFGVGVIDDTIIMADGTTFASGRWSDDGSPWLVRITADGYEELPAPPLSVTRLHAVGANAPAVSPYYDADLSL